MKKVLHKFLNCPYQYWTGTAPLHKAPAGSPKYTKHDSMVTCKWCKKKIKK